MQNCLQSKRKRKVYASFAALVLVSVIIAAAVFVVNLYNDSFDGSGKTKVKYLSQLSVNGGAANVKYDANNEENEAKMNNQNAKVAKNEQKSAEANECASISDSRVRVLTGDGSVCEMPLEDYIIGCVLGEMPLSFETQALMAQSVAVRTFTVRQMMQGKSKHTNADVCTNPACCQSYVFPESKNLSEDMLKKLSGAVLATKGIIMVYDGEPIVAVYHASSGTSTLSSEDVWGGKVEYLRSVPSPDGEEAISAGGFGHRVGMSQHGANILAGEGRSYKEILKYYYSGISFCFV